MGQNIHIECRFKLVSNKNDWGKFNIVDLLTQMKYRHAANEVDKIAGLAYLLGWWILPTYKQVADCI